MDAVVYIQARSCQLWLHPAPSHTAHIYGQQILRRFVLCVVVNGYNEQQNVWVLYG